MYTPMTKLTTKTSTVRLRTCSRVGQETFFSSDHASFQEAAESTHSAGSSFSYGCDWQGR